MRGGHVRKRLRPDGSVQGWQAMYPDPEDKNKRIMTTKRTRREAEEWLAEQRLAVRDGTHVDPRRANRPFSELVEAWRAGRYLRLQPKTRARYDQIVRKYLLPEFGNTPTSAITKEAVTRYFATLANNPKISAGTTRKVHTVMSAIFTAAVRQEIVRRNPCRDLEDALPSTTTKEMLVLTAAEVQTLASHPALTQQDRLAIFLAAYTGLRADEMWALTRADYDPLRGVLHVRRAIKGHDPIEIGTPKNGNGRTVGLPTSIKVMLDAHLSSSPYGNSAKQPTPTDLIFTTPGGGAGRKAGDGTYVRHGLWMRRVFRPAVKAALPPSKHRLRFHDLRHTCASLLIEAGAHALVIKERLGHSDIRTTLNTYGHLLPGLDDQATLALDAALSAAAVQPSPTANVTELHG